MDPKVQEAWEKFLNPDVMRFRLISASIFIAGFEALKDAIIGRIRDFFFEGFDQSGEIICSRYQSEVLALNKSPVYASLEWLKKMNAIDDADIQTFNRVKACRNLLAHKLFLMIASQGLPPDFDEGLYNMEKLLQKIEIWWIKNVELAINPDLEGVDIYDGELASGRVMYFQMLCDIALGSEKNSRLCLDEFKNLSRDVGVKNKNKSISKGFLR